MTDTTTASQGSAATQAGLWGERAGDWAELFEKPDNPWLAPAYQLVLDRLDVGAGTDLLDVGCGSGRFCRMAGDRGARVSGLDATPELLAIAVERNPGADLRVGDLQSLPFADACFDVVTGFNSFFYAADLVAAFREAARVVRPGGHVALTAFGRPERCESTPVFRFLGPLFPKHALEDEEPALHEGGVLESLLAQAGLTTIDAGYLEIAEEHPDTDTLLRGWLSVGPVRAAVRNAGEDAVREALTGAVAPLRTSTGGYRIEDEFRYLIARRAD